ncbi:HEPN family nuclease [Apibacter raozihei]|uniref:HEPN family nuclease n=1 Tax=Apibacter raozihei TaxID=2500547 RepID=UPI000FE357CF|nr:HEPN family nuclease [Apibacter raozihei]
MSYYKQQEFDFITRTRKILEQYNSLNLGNEKYEITLFMNCLVGLLIIPQQHWYDKLPTNSIERKDWGIAKEDIIKIAKEDYSVKNVARHLRNSISHYHLKACESKGEISSFIFKDFFNKKLTLNTKEISIEKLKKFVFTLCDYMLNEMENEKQI